tara:strand:- start:8691 stop:9359 length:669 start_codon:yes stop_codon:yes gene_type:complete
MQFKTSHIAELIDFINSKNPSKDVLGFYWSDSPLGDYVARKTRRKRNSKQFFNYVMGFKDFLKDSHPDLCEILVSLNKTNYGEFQQVLADNKITPYQNIGPKQLEWLIALESGEYPQTTGSLQDSSGFCCLGVAADLNRHLLRPHETASNRRLIGGYMPEDVRKELKLLTNSGALRHSLEVDPETEFFVYNLTELNDKARWSFKQIAQYIKSNPTNVFMEPA